MTARIVLSIVFASLILYVNPAEAGSATISLEARQLDDSLSEILQELARLEGVSENASMATCRRMHTDIAALRRQVARLRTDIREVAGPVLSVSVEVSDSDDGGRRRRPGRRETSKTPAPAPVPVAVPAPEPEPAGPTPISESDFNRLLARIGDESFSSGKLRVLDDAADYAWLTSAQVVRILGLFNFASDQLKALELIARNIVDHENAFEIYAAFTFDSDKEKARAILRAVR